MSEQLMPLPFRSLQQMKVSVTIALLVGVTQAFAQPSAGNTATVNIEAYGDSFVQAKPVAGQLSKLLVYRSNLAQSTQPVNIYLDGHYHASLLKGGFSETCLTPGALSVQSILDDASRQHLGKQEAGQWVQFDAGKTVYMRLQESGYAKPVLQVVNSSLAQQELKNMRRQIHTVSRVKVARDCLDGDAVATAAPLAVVPAKVYPDQKFALEADALFEFGKADLRAAGYNAIELLVQKVKNEYTSVEQIRVSGYTDAIGPKKLNLKLSDARAVTVAEQIRTGGVIPTKGFLTEGKGSANLVKTDCANEPTPQNKQCHAPNRRVEVIVIGARR
jgi:OOP family OmpA-OmpF porin